MEIKTNGKFSQNDLLQKIKDCMQNHGFSLIKELSGQAGKVYEFESSDMTIKMWCRFPQGNPSNVFIEFDIPNIAKKLKEALST